MKKELINRIVNITFIILVIGLVSFGLYNRHLNNRTQYSIIFSNDPNYNQPDGDYNRAWEEEASQCQENPVGSKRCEVTMSELGRPTLVTGEEAAPKIQVKTKTIVTFPIKPELLAARYALFYKLLNIIVLISLVYFALDYFVFRFKKKSLIDHVVSITGRAILLTVPLLVLYALLHMPLFFALEGKISYHAINSISMTIYGIGAIAVIYYLYTKKLYEIASAVPLSIILLTLFLHFLD